MIKQYLSQLIISSIISVSSILLYSTFYLNKEKKEWNKIRRELTRRKSNIDLLIDNCACYEKNGFITFKQVPIHIKIEIFESAQWIKENIDISHIDMQGLLVEWIDENLTTVSVVKKMYDEVLREEIIYNDRRGKQEYNQFRVRRTGAIRTKPGNNPPPRR